jgi:hypothetical protein
MEEIEVLSSPRVGEKITFFTPHACLVRLSSRLQMSDLYSALFEMPHDLFLARS